jgi:hypothetical protein
MVRMIFYNPRTLIVITHLLGSLLLFVPWLGAIAASTYKLPGTKVLVRQTNGDN